MRGWRMRCLVCGNAAPKMLSHLNQGNGICAYCAEHGFKPDRPAEIYIVIDETRSAGKYGIAGLDNGSYYRVAQHERENWSLYESWTFEVGAQAQRVERMIEHELRVVQGVPQFLPAGSMPQNGETETFDLKLCSAEQTWALVKRFARQIEDEVTPTLRATIARRRRIRNSRAQIEVMHSGAQALENYPEGTGSKWRMRCLICGKAHPRRLAHLREGRAACPACRQDEISESRRVPVLRAVAIMRSALAEPLAGYPSNAGTPWKSRCMYCGSRTDPRLANVSSGQGACKTCAQTRSGEDRRLPPETAEARFRALALEPLEDYKVNSDAVRCRCLNCGKSSSPLPGNAFFRRTGCEFCNRQKLADRYRTPAASAAIIMRAGAWEPLTEYRGAKEPWLSRCMLCGTTGRPTKTNIQHRGAGAPEGRARHRRPRRSITDSTPALPLT